MKKRMLIGVAAAAALLLAACITETSVVRPTGDEGWQAPSKGPKDAPVTIYEFSDFDCPFCSKVLPTVEAIREEYGDRVRLVFRQFPLSAHKNAHLAAQAALAAHDQGKFWAMHDLLFEHQGALEREALDGLARHAGLDPDLFAQALDKGTFVERVDEDTREGRSLGVRGTPAFVINGEVLFGAQPIADFRAAIEDALARAETLEKEGVSRESLDAEFLKRAKERLAAAGKPRDAAVAVKAGAPAAETDPHGLAEARKRPVEGDPKVPDRHAIPASGSPSIGPDDAAVTLVVFSDFQCPYCAHMHATLKEVVAAYPGKVRLVFKHFPLDFHDMARPAAEAALSAQDQGKFWPMHDALMAVGGGKSLTREAVFNSAKTAGIDTAKLEADLRAEAHKSQIDKDLSLGAELDVQGTPTLFINGKKYSGASMAENLKAAIEEELRRR
ncbi:MAG: thioredoxin domain-containing protein [Deltaproteobacteria bacterium]|nr:thioredoxin domain-containing protein [Deltaproteobacteria bacterium]